LFLKAKSDVKGKFLTLLTDLKIAGLDVKYIQCNDSGENKALFDECRSKGYNMNFEFSAPRTPQRNGNMERKFQTLFGRIRAMLNRAGVKDQLISGVWAECAMIVTFISNVISIKNNEVCTYEFLFGCKPKLPTSLRSFGEIGIVTTKANIQSKLKNRGTPCMFVGYSVHHVNDFYRMLNLDTKNIIQSRNIILLNEAYHDWIDRKVLHKKETDDEDDDVIANSKIQEVKDGQDKLSSVQVQDELKKKNIYRAMQLLESSFNPEVSTML
jgi:hypothetical protein